MMCFVVCLFSAVHVERNKVSLAGHRFISCSQLEVPAANGRVTVSCLTAQEVTAVTSIEVGVGYRSSDPIYINKYLQVTWNAQHAGGRNKANSH